MNVVELNHLSTSESVIAKMRSNLPYSHNCCEEWVKQRVCGTWQNARAQWTIAHHHKSPHGSAGTHRSLSFQILSDPKGFTAHVKRKSTFWPDTWGPVSSIPYLFLCARHSSDVMLKAWNNLSPNVSFFHSLTSFKTMINSDFLRKTYWATLPQMWVPCFAFFPSDRSVTCISLYIWYLLLSLSFCYNVNSNWARNCPTFSLVLVWNSFWHTVCDQ